jgi:hypothetical protein
MFYIVWDTASGHTHVKSFEKAHLARRRFEWLSVTGEDVVCVVMSNKDGRELRRWTHDE